MIPGPMELVIILIIVAMLFGVGRLPEIFGAVGKGIREFRQEAMPPTPATPPATNVVEPVEPIVVAPVVPPVTTPADPERENR